MERRTFLKVTAGAAAAAAGGVRPAPRAAEPSMRKRSIPRSGEQVPVIGLGTWQTFDVGSEDSARAPLTEVLRRFFAAGGRVIDSSPMYGRAEAVAGDLVAAGKHPAFFATKVWTSGTEAGREQMAESMRRLRTGRLDLMQVHNLLDWKRQLATMREWRDAEKIRYLGITHFSPGEFAEMERMLRSEKLDFVQLPYSVTAREAEARLLPAAADTGTAVVVMRPFQEGALFHQVRGRSLPAWAAERGFQNWAQLFLGFIVTHPAVTCVIPATANPEHVSQNVLAGSGPELDADLRRRLVAELGG
ncbi:MAG: aldo/keto reductase [Acidobacteria bacterium]|nr:aldo/keto reductase [Acidobacteriota bacterium]